MNLIKQKYNINLSKAINYMIVLYAVVLPLGYALANIMMATMMVLLVCMLVANKIKTSRKTLIWIAIFSSHFFFSIFSLIYTKNTDYGLSMIIRKSSIFVFPAFIFIFKEYLEIKYIRKAFLWYTISIIFICIISLLITITKCIGSDAVFTIECISAENLSASFISYHKLYFSLYITIGIYFLNYNLFKNNKHHSKKYFFYKILANFVLILTLILLGSRTQLAISAILLIVIPQIMWFKERKYANIFYSFLVLILIGGINIKYNPLLVDKIKEAINYNNEYHIKKKWGGASVRKLIWEYSFYVVKDNPFLGVGIGDVQNELNESYLNCVKSSALEQKNGTYNAHNDLLQILISTGIFGLFSFLACYSYIFVISLKKLNYLHCGFIIIFFLSGLTESYLERDMGIRILAFFSPILFILKNPYEDTADT